MRSLFTDTPASRIGAIDGLNLFFGALLGANLGTLDGLRLVDYVKLVVLFAGTVMTLRMISTSDRRLQVFILAAVYALMLVALVLLPELKPDGLRQADLHRVVATLAVWFTFVLALEFIPVKERPKPAEPCEDAEPQA